MENSDSLDFNKNERIKKFYYLKINLRDSMTLLNYSLDYLTTQLKVDHPKLIFPHKFVNKII